MFSKSFGYAVRAVVHIANQGDGFRRLSLLEISDTLNVPHHFMGKILQDLVRHGFVDSFKGPNGGFRKNERTASTRVIEILRMTDGSHVHNICILGMRDCNAERPCPLHHAFGKCREDILRLLADKTVGELAADVSLMRSFLA
ncbi:MAG: Rrf2 family transcriptional regulator [Saprospiraceae bacterium]|nr:Rrf2 family transcriptional regulator [Saprospiraceae bacterium]